jgi:hypothetical protein
MPRKLKHPIAALAKRGAEVRWVKVKAARKPLEPYSGTILDLMDAAGLVGRHGSAGARSCAPCSRCRWTRPSA